MYADMTAITIQLNEIVLNDLKDKPTRAIFWGKAN